MWKSVNRYAAKRFLNVLNYLIEVQTKPLWIKTIAHHRQMKTWAAGEIEQMVVTTEYNQAARTAHIRKQLQASPTTHPQYEIVSAYPPVQDNEIIEPFDLSTLFASTEQELLAPHQEPERLESQMLGRQRCVVFQLHNGKIRFTLWVHPRTGQILQKQISMAIAHVLEGQVTMNFTDTGGMRLPASAHTLMKVLVPERESHLEIKEVFSAWRQLA